MASSNPRKPTANLTANLRPIASLNPGLLARKGGARPAMRHQAQALAFDCESDLGWNDFGDAAADQSAGSADIVPINGRIGARTGKPRGRALDRGGKAAFTLRLDAERHLKLRLACTLEARSAQALVTDALDRLLAERPDLADLIEQVCPVKN